MTVNLAPNGIRAEALLALAGTRMTEGDGVVDVAALNEGGAIAEVWDSTVDTATNDTAYVMTLSDASGNVITTSTYTSDASATKPEIADGLALAWNANALAYSWGIAVSDGVDVVTVTGQTKNRAFAVSTAGATVSDVNTTDAAAGTEIDFGLALCASMPPASGATPHAVLPSGVCSSQSQTLTVTYAAGKEYVVEITWRGLAYRASATANTDDDTTAADIEAAIAALMPANSVDESVAANVVTLTSEIAGEPFTVRAFVAGTPGSAAIVLGGSPMFTDDLSKVFLGIATRSLDVEQSALGSAVTKYPVGFAMVVRKKGTVAVAIDAQPTSSFDVYIGTASSNDGEFFSTAGADRALLPAAQYARPLGDGLAALAL